MFEGGGEKVHHRDDEALQTKKKKKKKNSCCRGTLAPCRQQVSFTLKRRVSDEWMIYMSRFFDEVTGGFS